MINEAQWSSLSAYLDNALSSTERAEVDQRLQTDAEWQAALAELRFIKGSLQAAPELVPPRDLRLTPDRVKRRQSRLTWRQGLALGAGLAATLVCVFGIVLSWNSGLRVMTGQAIPEVTFTAYLQVTGVAIAAQMTPIPATLAPVPAIVASPIPATPAPAVPALNGAADSVQVGGGVIAPTVAQENSFLTTPTPRLTTTPIPTFAPRLTGTPVQKVSATGSVSVTVIAPIQPQLLPPPPAPQATPAARVSPTQSRSVWQALLEWLLRLLIRR
jgi:anti-sigma factor RsiW